MKSFVIPIFSLDAVLCFRHQHKRGIDYEGGERKPKLITSTFTIYLKCDTFCSRSRRY